MTSPLRLSLICAFLGALLVSCSQRDQGGLAEYETLPVREGTEERESEVTNRETLEERGEQDDIPIVANDSPLCTFGRRQAPLAMIYRDRDGTPVDGEIPPNNYTWFPRRIPSVLAEPVSQSYRVVQSRDCRDPETNTFYSCPEVTEVDFSDIRGIGRSTTREDAIRLAARACRNRIQERMASQVDTRLESQDLQCRVVETNRCDPGASSE